MAVDENLDDVEFVRQILSDLKRTFTLDTQRIYAAGFSNGAMMAYRLGCDMSGIFAAIAAVQGPLFYDQCQPEHAVSLIHVHGLRDPIVPYLGGEGICDVCNGIVFPPVQVGVEKWMKWNECSNLPQVSVNGAITHIVYPGCVSDTAVELYTIDGLEHAWPSPFGSGQANFPATQSIWDFFVTHPKINIL